MTTLIVVYAVFGLLAAHTEAWANSKVCKNPFTLRRCFQYLGIACLGFFAIFIIISNLDFLSSIKD